MITGGSRFGSGAGPGRRAGLVSGFGLEGVLFVCFFSLGRGGGGATVGSFKGSLKGVYTGFILIQIYFFIYLYIYIYIYIYIDMYI